MAGGEGSRLRPLTCDRPKPMVPVMDRPIMEHIVELLHKHNFHDIGATLMYLPEAIKDYFGDGSEFGVNMRYFIEETPLGTAGSVKNGQEFLDETFLVISGDALTDFNLTEVFKFHKQKKSAVTIVLTKVENPLEYGVVITDEQSRIKQFLEKPSWGEVFSDTVNTGIYVIEPEILKLIPPKTKFDFSKDLFPMLLEKKYPMFGCVMPGYWCDIGNLRQYQQAHYDILSGWANINISGKKLTEGIWMGKGAEVHPEARIDSPVFIGNNVKIGKDAYVGKHSAIGSNSILDEGASLKRSIIWNNVYVGTKATLRGATACNRVKIKTHSSIYEGGVIGDDTVLDTYTSIKPGVKVWPHKSVGKGTILSESLVWGTKASKNLFGTNGITGEVNVEITPEIATSIGASYGSCINKHGQVIVGADGNGSSQMIKNAIAVGLLSSGCNVLDLGKVITPVSRYAVRTLGVNGGVHVSSLNNGDKILLSFFNNKGANISKAEERKIENAFWREDYRRVDGIQIGLTSVFPDIIGSYVNELIKQLGIKRLRQANLKVWIDYTQDDFGEILPDLLEKLGCEVVLNELPRDGSRTWDYIINNSEEVIKSKCDLGIALSPNGEQLILIDDKGRVIQDDLFTALITLLILKSNAAGTVAVPVTAPGVIEEIASQYKGTVVRTKTTPQAFMEKILEEQIISTQGNYNQFKLQFDAISAFGNILDYLAKERVRLSELIDTIPAFYMSRRDIECPWDAKGRVMRRLIEEQNEKTELLDGVKVYHEEGWALVIPDSDEPICRVFSEGANMEIAEELTAMYADKINGFKKI